MTHGKSVAEGKNTFDSEELRGLLREYMGKVVEKSGGGMIAFHPADLLPFLHGLKRQFPENSEEIDDIFDQELKRFYRYEMRNEPDSSRGKSVDRSMREVKTTRGGYTAEQLGKVQALTIADVRRRIQEFLGLSADAKSPEENMR